MKMNKKQSLYSNVYELN